jgi:deoxyribodipyrimidine photolyase-related protein
MTLLLFPTQLFYNIDYLKENKISNIILYEEPKFFTKHNYHKLKLLYHRITCKIYYKWLKSKNIKCEYIDFNTKLTKLITHIIDPIDHELEKKYIKKYPDIIILSSQHFTLTTTEVKENSQYFMSKKNKFNHSKFYRWQRQRLNILVDKNNNPEGNQWSFDKENRYSLPKNEIIPDLPKNNLDKQELEDAKKYIEQHFKNNYGEMNMIYPVDHSSSKKWLKNFVEKRLYKFGKYQDASFEKEPFLYHSVLTPMLNIGLLTDWDVLNEVLEYKKKIPIASLEGFIRQVIGWRNYMFCIYVLNPNISKENFFKSKNKLNNKWWTGDTGFIPIDDIIKNKIVKYAYTHHIERLMYLGGIMLILNIHPSEVFRIFMEWTIDAYDWVMIPNIYGMSQFADGGKVMLRPYFSASNYILKMSNYKKNEWCNNWDALYYAFLHKHITFFEKNYFYSSQIKYWKSQSSNWQKEKLKLAKKIIKELI